MPVLTRAHVRRARAARTLAAAWRERQRRKGVDPIMLVPIERPWRHVDAATNVVTYFDSTSLAQYIEATGNTLHPLTRVPFTRVELARLQRDSGIDLQKALRRHQQQRREREPQAAGLEEFLEADVARVVQTVTDESANDREPVAHVMLRCRMQHGGRFTEALANLHRGAPTRVRGACERAILDAERAAGRAIHEVVLSWFVEHVRRVRARLLGGQYAAPAVPIPPPPPFAAREPYRGARGFRRLMQSPPLHAMRSPPVPILAPVLSLPLLGRRNRRHAGRRSDAAVHGE